MAVLNQPKYLSFDHQYVETVVVTDDTRLDAGVASNRFVNRSGAYPAANGYAAGVSLFDIYGPQLLTGYNKKSLGTVTVNGSTDLATFQTANATNNLEVGSVISIEGQENNFVIKSIDSTTTATLAVLGGGDVPAISPAAEATRLEARGGYGVDGPTPSLRLGYEGRLNASTTPYAPRIFPYQKHLSVVTTGIAIVQVDTTSNITLVLDDPIAVGANGQAKKWTTGVSAGRCLDNIIALAGDIAYIRVKLGNEAGA